MADTTAADAVRQAPWRESSRAPRAAEPVASARAANATPASARATRKDRRVPLSTPARMTELPAPRETVQPLAAAPLAAAASDAMVVPPSVAPPPPVAASPTTALEVTKVDVRPEVVKRVNARTSKAAAGTPEMVVLRVLVSAAGSPGTVHVLRGSKVDPDSDGAAVAAVKQWAFSPALKRGRPVDCWFNVAVPVEGAAQ
jgi:TonB family protein